MKNVLIINQSAELYGADKALLELLENYPKDYCPIVVLHQDGPLKDILLNKGIQVIHSSVIKVKRGILKPKFFITLPFEIIKSFKTINKELQGKPIHLVHSNAISVFIGAFYSFIFRKKHLWHVHEIIEHPEFLAKAYPKIVSFFATKIVFNSTATFNQFDKIKKGLESKSAVVHNGQDRLAAFSTTDEIQNIRRNLFHIQNPDAFVIGLVGRISRLKGQRVLLKAFSQLAEKYSHIHLVYVGSAPDGQEQFLHKLEHHIQKLKLENRVSIVDFQQNIWPIYDAIDVKVVPSTEPESFGLVATEAMLSKKPVIGSDLGGLKEIIAHEKTGFLFEPGNDSELASQLEILIQKPERAAEMGENGLKRVKEKFSNNQYVNGIKTQYDSLTNLQ